MGGLLPLASKDNNGFMSKEQYNRIFPLLGKGTSNKENSFIKITFIGKWSALIGVIKNASYSCGLVYIANGRYDSNDLRSKLMSNNNLDGIKFYCKTNKPSEILIGNLGAWAECSAVVLTGKVDNLEEVDQNNISLSDYKEIPL